MSDKMTWEETIEFIRNKPEYEYLVEKAFFEADLPLNIERFKESEEFLESLKLLNLYAPNAKRILDVGSGNGISAVSFALKGYHVTATEPDPSNTIGAGAIRSLKSYYQLDSLEVFEEFAENINYKGELFDVIYVRQAMHHAYNLNQFISNLSRVLKPGGILLTVRDHVIFDEKDKEWFLQSHPLHKYYGGENAFTEKEYCQSFRLANLTLLKTLKFFDSPINYFPAEKSDFLMNVKNAEIEHKRQLSKRIGFFANISFIREAYFKRVGFNPDNYFDETKIPGRMYSFIAKK